MTAKRPDPKLGPIADTMASARRSFFRTRVTKPHVVIETYMHGQQRAWVGLTAPQLKAFMSVLQEHLDELTEKPGKPN